MSSENTAAASAEVAAHLESCAACRNWRAEQEADARLARAALGTLKPVAAPADLRLKVRAALQDERQFKTRPAFDFGQFSRNLVWSAPVCLAALAILLLAKPPAPTRFTPSETAPNAVRPADSPAKSVAKAPSSDSPRRAPKPATRAPIASKSEAEPPVSLDAAASLPSQIPAPKAAATAETTTANAAPRSAAPRPDTRATSRDTAQNRPLPTSIEAPAARPSPRLEMPEMPPVEAPSATRARAMAPSRATGNGQQPVEAPSAASKAAPSMLPPISSNVLRKQTGAALNGAPPARFSIEIAPLAAPSAPSVANTTSRTNALEARPSPAQMAPAPAAIPAPATASGQRNLAPDASNQGLGQAQESRDDSSAMRSNRSGAGGRGGFSAPMAPRAQNAPRSESAPSADASAFSASQMPTEAAPRWNFKILASSSIKGAQIRLILPPTLRFVGADGIASRVVWRGDLEAGKATNFEVFLLGARGRELISVVVEQNGGAEQSKPLETRILALPAPTR